MDNFQGIANVNPELTQLYSDLLTFWVTSMITFTGSKSSYGKDLVKNSHAVTAKLQTSDLQCYSIFTNVTFFEYCCFVKHSGAIHRIGPMLLLVFCAVASVAMKRANPKSLTTASIEAVSYNVINIWAAKMYQNISSCQISVDNLNAVNYGLYFLTFSWCKWFIPAAVPLRILKIVDTFSSSSLLQCVRFKRM